MKQRGETFLYPFCSQCPRNSGCALGDAVQGRHRCKDRELPVSRLRFKNLTYERPLEWTKSRKLR